MKRIFDKAANAKAFVLATCLIVPWLVTSCGPSSDEIAAEKGAAESECRQLASARSGYDPSNPPGSKSSVGKGAAIGAAAGAGAGAIKDNEDRKKAEQAAAAYQTEYQFCMKGKGF